jgi:hypothetical protein
MECLIGELDIMMGQNGCRTPADIERELLVENP